jgi:type 1 glutamine amidotransferase
MADGGRRAGAAAIGLWAAWLGAVPVQAEGRERFSEPEKPSAVRVLVVTGGHDYDTDFYTLFEGDWLTWSHAVSSGEAYAGDIRDRYDVLVLYDMTSELGETERRNLRTFVESRKGVVAIHHAIVNYGPAWEWWWRDVIAGRYILEEGGPGPSSYKHDVELFVRSVVDHPITRDLGPIRLVDETYKDLWISPDVKVLLEVDEETADGPVAWISPYDKSRVVYIQLGHDRRAHRHPAYRELVKRAILWSAGRLE